jgi:thiol-disulfide isomerase/thioredoxin
MTDETTNKWRLFWKENWFLILVVTLLAAGYLFLRTPGDTFASLADLEARLTAGRPTIIEFYSNSCSICLVSKPQVDRLEARLEGQAEVLRLNVREEVGRQLATRWNVRGVPTFVVLDGEGGVVYASAGAPDVEALQAAVQEADD